ncbi:MAG TPA: glycosyltransferase, partial [Planctomycetota bacterium]|nr:glycosyltransferase [Planctomycetota bacterium]
MARILLASTAERGHVNPLVGVAQRLLEADHEVGWLCLPRAPEQLKTLKVERVSADLPDHEHITGGEALARLVRDGAALRRWIAGLLIDAVPGQIEPLRHALRHFGPDVVATDPMLYGVIIAAELEGRPWAGISSSLNPLAPANFDCELTRTLGQLEAARLKLFAAHGLSPRFKVSDCLSPSLNVVFSTPEFTREIGEPAPATQQVGPSIPPQARGDEPRFDWKRLDFERPLIYASFGSQISWQPEIFGKLARACENLPVQLVISAGELAATDWARGLPKNCLAVPYAPQLRLLERA